MTATGQAQDRRAAAAGPPPWLDELTVAPGPPWHAMGTRALADDGWLVVDAERAEQLALKRALLDTAHDVVVAGATGAEPAAEEAAAAIAAATGGTLEPGRPPLEAAALLVQEDLCLLVRGDDGWRLTAGVVCFPSLWRITEKVGLPITAVHGRVPAYDVELSARVDRFLDRLRPGRPVWRRNWLVHDSPALHQPWAPEAHAVPAVPDGLWLRSERQTLRCLPSTGAVLFTIRTQQAPFAVLAARPEIAAGVAAAVRSWSPDLVDYRGAALWRTEALSWLDGLTEVRELTT